MLLFPGWKNFWTVNLSCHVCSCKNVHYVAALCFVRSGFLFHVVARLMLTVWLGLGTTNTWLRFRKSTLWLKNHSKITEKSPDISLKISGFIGPKTAAKYPCVMLKRSGFIALKTAEKSPALHKKYHILLPQSRLQRLLKMTKISTYIC